MDCAVDRQRLAGRGVRAEDVPPRAGIHGRAGAGDGARHRRDDWRVRRCSTAWCSKTCRCTARSAGVFQQALVLLSGFSEVRARGADVFSKVAAWNMDGMHVAWAQELEPTEVLTASGDFYATLGITAADRPHLRTGRRPDRRRPSGTRRGHQRCGVAAALRRRPRRASAEPCGSDRTSVHHRRRHPAGLLRRRARAGAGNHDPADQQRAAPARLQSATSSWVHLLGRLRDGVTLAGSECGAGTFLAGGARGDGPPKACQPDRRAVYPRPHDLARVGAAGFSRVRNRFAQPLWLLFGAGRPAADRRLRQRGEPAARARRSRGGAKSRCGWRLAPAAARLVRQMLTESLVWTAIAAQRPACCSPSWGAGALLALMTHPATDTIVLDAGVNWRVAGVLDRAGGASRRRVVRDRAGAAAPPGLDPASGLKSTTDVTAALRPRWSFGKIARRGAGRGRRAPARQRRVVRAQSLSGAVAETPASIAIACSSSPPTSKPPATRTTALARFYQDLLERAAGGTRASSPPASRCIRRSATATAPGRRASASTARPDVAPGASTVYFNTVSPDYFRTDRHAARARPGFQRRRQRQPRRASRSSTKRWPGGSSRARTRSDDRSRSAGTRPRRTCRSSAWSRDAKYQRLQETPRAHRVSAVAAAAGRQHVRGAARRGPDRGRRRDQKRGRAASTRSCRCTCRPSPTASASRSSPNASSRVAGRRRSAPRRSRSRAPASTACSRTRVSRQAREIGLRLALGAERRARGPAMCCWSRWCSARHRRRGGPRRRAGARPVRGGCCFRSRPRDPVSIGGGRGGHARRRRPRRQSCPRGAPRASIRWSR